MTGSSPSMGFTSGEEAPIFDFPTPLDNEPIESKIGLINEISTTEGLPPSEANGLVAATNEISSCIEVTSSIDSIQAKDEFIMEFSTTNELPATESNGLVADTNEVSSCFEVKCSSDSIEAKDEFIMELSTTEELAAT